MYVLFIILLGQFRFSKEDYILPTSLFANAFQITEKPIPLKLTHIKYLTFFIFFIGLYFGGRYCVNTLALFVVVAIIGFFIEGIRPIKEFPKLLLIPIGFAILHIISSFYSSNQFEAQFDLEVKFSFLLLPIIFGLQKNNRQIDFIIILRLFSVASIISLLVLMGINGLKYFETGNMLFYNEYSYLLHPSYLSMYLSFNILIAVFLLSQKKGNTYCLVFSIVLSLINIYIAESKAGQLTTLILVVFIAFKLIPAKFRKFALGFSIILVLIFGYLAKDGKRFSFFVDAIEHYSDIVGHPEEVTESTAMRILAWSASYQVILENPIFGVGNGDIKDELSVVYAERKFIKPLEMHMNSHNQYLETGVGQGLLGLSILLLLLFLPLYLIKEYPIITQGFILIVALNILVESMFNTQAGVIFIVFFYSFIFSNLGIKSKDTII